MGASRDECTLSHSHSVAVALSAPLNSRLEASCPMTHVSTLTACATYLSHIESSLQAIVMRYSARHKRSQATREQTSWIWRSCVRGRDDAWTLGLAAVQLSCVQRARRKERHAASR